MKKALFMAVALVLWITGSVQGQRACNCSYNDNDKDAHYVNITDLVSEENCLERDEVVTTSALSNNNLTCTCNFQVENPLYPDEDGPVDIVYTRENAWTAASCEENCLNFTECVPGSD